MVLKLGVVGLGYVGLPVAVEFGKKIPVIGFDINVHRVKTLKAGIDYTGEVTSGNLGDTQIEFTSDESKLRNCNFIIIAVPTPIDQAKNPNLEPLIKASETVGRNLSRGSVVVYESTVYPGATEEVCIPILEQVSGLKSGGDFHVGYSPERINPGDKEHTFRTIVKVVSAQDEHTLSIVADTYSMVVDAGVYRAPTIKTAEAAKVIENTQRDINIALMNELAVIFDKLGIDTQEVLKASSTKWNFIPFNPGLVGGHCIGVDPYYLTYKAESVGHHPQVILAGRRINDSMGQYIASSLIKQMILARISIQGARIGILGMTFKENVPDIRNSKVIDIIQELEEFGINVYISDSLADPEQVEKLYGKKLLPISEISNMDAIILAVPHQDYLNTGWIGITSMLTNSRGIVVDVKSVLDISKCPDGIKVWRL